MIAKIYLYSRVSSGQQLDGHGLERQDDNNTRDAKKLATKYGLKISDPITDAGISAYKGHNLAADAGLGGFLAEVSAGKIARGSWLVVDEFSRLTRLGHRKLMVLMNQLLEGGVSVSVNQREFLHDAEGMDDAIGMVFAILQGSKDFDSSREKGKLVGDAWKRKRASVKEKVLTGQVVRWCRVVDGKIQLIPERAEIVREIFAWYLAGDGYTTIANKLNAKGVKTWQGGKQWYIGYVQKILCTPAVLGTLQMKDGQLAEDYYPRVISDADFKSATHIRQQKNEQAGFAGRNAAGTVNPFRGLLTCCGCGGKLTFHNDGRKGLRENRYYICKAFGCEYYRRRWKFEAVLDAVMEEVNEHVWLSPDPLTVDRSQEIAVAEAKLTELRADQEAAFDRSLKATSENVRAKWDTRIEQLESQIAALEKEVEELKTATTRDHQESEAFRESAGTFRASRDLTPEQLRQHARNLLAGIIVNCLEKTFSLQWKVGQQAA